MSLVKTSSRRDFLKTGFTLGAAATAATAASAVAGFNSAFATPASAAAGNAAAASATPVATAELKVLQLNTWIYASRVPNGPQTLAAAIADADPDVVLLCELDSGALIKRLAADLAKRGKKYYVDGKNIQTGILSKYPLEETGVIIATPPDSPSASGPNSLAHLIGLHRAITKSQITVGGRVVVLYSAHLDWQKYAPYLPRGYGLDGTKLSKPASDAAKILAVNRTAFRDEAIKYILPDLKKERAKGRLVIFGGDLNEPSHLDWREDTKDIRQHNGTVVDWDVSLMLQGAGFVDSFREQFPNAVTHPGFTWTPKTNAGVVVRDGDERERIDFIYYSPQAGVALKSIKIFGPAETVLNSKPVSDNAQDIFIQQKLATWPSDHKGVFATFKITGTDTPRPAAKQKLKFAFLTDSHVSHALSKKGFKHAVQTAKKCGVDFIILGGDLVNISGYPKKLSQK
jgi:endonuclease/exonuclease/phosphatase family metal-dependent hydrolase